MCCFVVPMAEAIAVTAVRRHLAKSSAKHGEVSNKEKLFKVSKLESMLWGGTIFLVVDHVINGELTWRFPFFTGDPENMLHEILTTGVAMSVICTIIWAFWAKFARKSASAIA